MADSKNQVTRSDAPIALHTVRTGEALNEFMRHVVREGAGDGWVPTDPVEPPARAVEPLPTDVAEARMQDFLARHSTAAGHSNGLLSRHAAESVLPAPQGYQRELGLRDKVAQSMPLVVLAGKPVPEQNNPSLAAAHGTIPGDMIPDEPMPEGYASQPRSNSGAEGAQPRTTKRGLMAMLTRSNKS